MTKINAKKIKRLMSKALKNLDVNIRKNEYENKKTSAKKNIFTDI